MKVRGERRLEAVSMKDSAPVTNGGAGVINNDAKSATRICKMHTRAQAAVVRLTSSSTFEWLCF